MESLNNLIREILEKGHLMSLGTVDDNGPWVSDVIFVFDDQFNLYWISEEDTRHSLAIVKNERVAAAITLSNKSGEPNIGLQIAGNASKIDGGNLGLSKKHYAKRNKPEPNKDVLDEGESWYKISPNLIEIIYEPLFGFNKKQVKLNIV